jgi:hypothetical protein
MAAHLLGDANTACRLSPGSRFLIEIRKVRCPQSSDHIEQDHGSFADIQGAE